MKMNSHVPNRGVLTLGQSMISTTKPNTALRSVSLLVRAKALYRKFKMKSTRSIIREKKGIPSQRASHHQELFLTSRILSILHPRVGGIS
jgi:hypothetical protein